MKHLKVQITGRVQGVTFRDSARAVAEEAGVAGSIRNEPDGSVTAVVEGDEPALDQFLDWARRGPPGARVDRLETKPGSVRNLDGFQIEG